MTSGHHDNTEPDNEPAVTGPLRCCAHCHIEYPSEILADLIQYTRLRGKQTVLVCGICALDLENMASGIVRLKFGGEQAEKLRQAAIAYRAQFKNL